MRKRLASVGMTLMLVLGAGAAGAVTSPGPPGGIIERPEAPTIFELLDVPVPGPTGSADPPEEVDADEGEDVQEDGHEGDQGGGPSGHGKRVSDAAHDDRFSGCEKGMHVSEVASGGRAHPNGSPCDRGKGSEKGNGPPPHAGGPPPHAGGPPPHAGGPPPWAGGGGPPH